MLIHPVNIESFIYFLKHLLNKASNSRSFDEIFISMTLKFNDDLNKGLFREVFDYEVSKHSKKSFPLRLLVLMAF